MRALIVIAIPVTFALIGWFVWSLTKAQQQKKRRVATKKASWTEGHDSRHGRTRVMVKLVAEDPLEELVLEMQIIEIISDVDPEYTDKFLQAMDEARERASTLNSERR